MFSITACLLLATAHARDFPLLPVTYSLSVEANLINLNTTKLQHEAYDGDHGRVAFVVVEDGGASRHLVELASGVVVEWTERREPGGPRVATGCAATPERRSFTVDLARHELRTSNEFLAAAPEGEAYLGVSSARGIATDLWRRAANNSYIAFEMLYEFSAAGWAFGGAAGNATVPVRATLRGTAFYGNDGAPLPAPRGFHHVYEFVNYRDSVDAIRDFALPYEVVFEASERLDVCDASAVTDPAQVESLAALERRNPPPTCSDTTKLILRQKAAVLVVVVLFVGAFIGGAAVLVVIASGGFPRTETFVRRRLGKASVARQQLDEDHILMRVRDVRAAAPDAGTAPATLDAQPDRECI